MNNQDLLTIVIVGAGFSGTITALEILKKASSALNLILINRQDNWCRGVAYSPKPDFLLNVPAKNMSALAQDPQHFLNWAKKIDPNISGEDFLPRKMYGKYLEEIFEEAIKLKNAAVSFKQVSDQVVDLTFESSNQLVQVHCSSGQIINANKVVLAIGNFAPEDPIASKIDLASKTLINQRYLRDPWAVDFDRLFQAKNIGLIGTGLTTIDIIYEAYLRNYQGNIFAISRRGLLPQAHCYPVKSAPIDFKLYPSLRQTFRQWRLSIQKLQEQGYEWQAFMETQRPHVQQLWMALTATEKKRFMRHLRPYWDIHRHRCARQVANAQMELRSQKKLEIIAGRIKAVTANSDHLAIDLATRSAAKNIELKIDYLVNCTGPSTDIRKIPDALMQAICKRGIASFDPNDLSPLGPIVNQEGALVDQDGVASKQVYTVGTLRRAKLWESIAVRELRTQAFDLANLLLS